MPEALANISRSLIHEALREFARLKKRKNMTELAGAISFPKFFQPVMT